ncbi:MAG: flagellum-specific synthase, partial [Actinoplanes sp.]|nr:flagellum-specific synthase [Actinoplanes sp.]
MTDLFRNRIEAALTAAQPLSRGKVTGAVGLRVTVGGLQARVGELLRIGEGEGAVYAEVAALDGDRLSCLPLGPIAGLGTGSTVVSTGGPLRVAVGPDLRGRVLDGLGRPMDGGPPLKGRMVGIDAAPPSAMDRQ